MLGYWEQKNTPSEDSIFKNVLFAIKGRDDRYFFDTLTDKPHLLKHKRQDGHTLLIEAAVEGCSQAVLTYLLENTEDLNHRNQAGFAVVHYLVSKNRHAYLKQLLEKGADKNLLTPNQETPASLAATYQAEEAMGVLTEAKADVNTPNQSQQQSPLHIACFGNNVRIITMLLANGASVDAIDLNGRSPLHYLAQNTKLTQEEKKTILEQFALKDANLGASHEGFTAVAHSSSAKDTTFSLELVKKSDPELAELCERLVDCALAESQTMRSSSPKKLK